MQTIVNQICLGINDMEYICATVTETELILTTHDNNDKVLIEVKEKHDVLPNVN